MNIHYSLLKKIGLFIILGPHYPLFVIFWTRARFTIHYRKGHYSLTIIPHPHSHVYVKVLIVFIHVETPHMPIPNTFSFVTSLMCCVLVFKNTGTYTVALFYAKCSLVKVCMCLCIL